MKRITLIIALLLIVINAGAQHTYVVLAGISNYGREDINLGLSTKDIKDLKNVFDNQEDVTVSMLTSSNVTRDNLVSKLKAVVQLAGEQDKIMFFFSGHGNVGGFNFYNLTLFKYSELISILSKAKTKNIFCFINACMSGSVGELMGSTFSFGSNESKIVFMMSSRAEEYSWEYSVIGNSYFHKALIKGLRGKADSNGDRQITVQELFSYVYKDVTDRTRDAEYQQHPQLIGPKSSFGTVLTKW